MSLRIAALEEELVASLGGAATLERALAPDWTYLRPLRKEALPIGWIEFGDEVIVETSGGPGGRWELPRTAEAMDFFEDLIRSVVAGRVIEVLAADRSRVEVTLADGSKAIETGYEGWRPRPGWRRKGDHRQYAPYQG